MMRSSVTTALVSTRKLVSAVCAAPIIFSSRRFATAPPAAAASAAAASPRPPSPPAADKNNKSAAAAGTKTAAADSSPAEPAPAGNSPGAAATPAPASSNTKQPLLKDGTRVSAFVDAGSPIPVAVGKVVAQLSENIYSVRFEVPDSGTVIEVGSRVVADKADGSTSAGLVAHVHGDGTLSILYDDDSFEAAVPRARISVSGGRLGGFQNSQTALKKYEGVVGWIKEAGVQKRIDTLSAAIVLYRRGWRRENMYLLEPADLEGPLKHLNKSVRAGILEAAEDEKVKRRVKREMMHEQLKERSSWAYRAMKYSGAFGAFAAAVSALSFFSWNLLNFRRQQRPAQVSMAISNMLQSLYRRRGGRRDVDEIVHRGETDRLCRFLESIDTDHPQLIFLTGNAGSGKSVAIKEAARKIGAPFVTVELRGNEKQDPIRTIAKAMGVTNIELCGDLFQFTSQVCGELRRATGTLPIIVLKPRATNNNISMAAATSSAAGGSGLTSSAFGSGSGAGSSSSSPVVDIGYVLNDALSLVSERHCAHVVVELDTETLTNLPQLPRTSIFHVDDMSPAEAKQYLAHRIDPVALDDVIANVGTNTIDLDELVTAVRHHGQDVDDVICAKLNKGIQSIRRQPLEMQTVLSEVAQQPYHAGVRRRLPKLEEAVGKGFLMYHFESQSWVFRSKALYEAAKINGGLE